MRGSNPFSGIEMGGRLHRQGPPPLGCVHGLDMNWASVFFTSSKMRCLHSWHSGRRQADPVRCSWFYVNALSRPLKLNSSLARDRAGIGGGRRNADEPLWIRLCVDRLRYLIPASADFEDLLRRLQQESYEIKRGKYVSLCKRVNQ